MLKIGDFSKLSRVSIRMLRHYDEIGLLKPAAIDPFTAYRYYGEDQLPRVARIIALRDMGFGLAAIGEMMRHADDRAAMERCLALRQAELKAQARETARQLLLLQTTLRRIRKDGTPMNYTVTVKTLPERYVASVRKVIPTYYQEGTLWDILMRETAPLNMQDGDPCYACAVFHDSDFREENVDVEVSKTVRGAYPNTENVVFKTEPAVQIASATYQGPYEKMPEVNEAVANYVRDNGYLFDGAPFNIYHISPYETKNAQEFVTEVCYPVRKA